MTLQKWEYFHLIWIAVWHILICFDWFRKYIHSIKIRFLTSLKYLSCLLCYLGIYRKPVIRETYSDIMKWTTIWQFPLPAGHCHSTGSTCNNCTYILIILEAQVEMILVAMTSYAWAFRNYQLTSLRMFWYAFNSYEESLGIKGPRVTIHYRKEGGWSRHNLSSSWQIFNASSSLRKWLPSL